MPTIDQKFSQDKYGTIRQIQDKIESWEAVLAIKFVQQFGLIAAETGGLGLPNDNPTASLMPVDVVIKRACDLAEALTKEIEARGWLIDMENRD